MRVISRSARRQALILLVAVGGFVLMYEATTIDSQDAAWEAIAANGEAAVPGSRLPFSATAYCKGSVTAAGVRPRSGIAAADPALLPVGTVVDVATGDSRYDGIYTIMDTGPEVQGRELDLYIWSCHEALKFGRKRVQVSVLRLGWDPKASSPSLIDRLFSRREAKRSATAAAKTSATASSPAPVAPAGPATTPTAASNTPEGEPVEGS